ncbi:MAG: PEP/pyruvate-binding domain-containing protein [Thermodesulfobacteriota bacterium]
MSARDPRATGGEASFAAAFRQFRRILALNNAVLEKIAAMENALAGEYVFDRTFLLRVVAELSALVREVVASVNDLADARFLPLYDRYQEIADRLAALAAGDTGPADRSFTLDYASLNSDLEELVGGKNATLGEIRNNLRLPAPDGFAITVAAYRRFMEAGDLFARLDDLAGSARQRAAAAAAMLSSAAVPEDVETAVIAELDRLLARCDGTPMLAVRSSGVGEDEGGRSFAGQFTSVLEVEPRPDAVLVAYKQVLASRFSAAALEYLGDADSRAMPMAVGVQPMIRAAVAGVSYSRCPDQPAGNRLLVTAVRGAARELVAGRKPGDRFTVGRNWPFALAESEIAAGTDGGDTALDLQAGGLRRGSASLTPAELRSLAEQALLLEKAFGAPQDIEWAMAGEPVILQSRPLALPAKPPPLPGEIAAELRAATPLLSGRGQVAQLGIGAGPVVHVDQETDAETFPVGAVAVARFPGPQLSPIVWRAAAIVTDIGGPTGHLATIAREYRTPALFGTGDASRLLAEGEEVTVDVENKTVYRGILQGLVRLQGAEQDPYRAAPELRTLRRLLRWVAPLTLTDPVAADFRAENCRTFHDIIRFSHEKAIDAVIHYHERGSGRQALASRPLRLPVPLRLRLIDLGGGLDTAARAGGDIDLGMVACRPLLALLDGLVTGAGRNRTSMPLGWRDLLAGMTRPLSLLGNWPAGAGDNLAIVSDGYVNLCLRLGYHINVVDTYFSDDPDNNYIYFRFAGGMAEKSKRERRARLIGSILAGLYFKVEQKGDLVTAKARQLDPPQMQRVLTRLGELIAFTRQLDVQMKEEAAVDEFFRRFLAAVRDDDGGSGA